MSSSIQRRSSRPRPVLFALSLIAALVATVFVPAATSASTTDPPRVMAALGDSITRASSADGTTTSSVENNWSTGAVPGFQSHRVRLEALYGAPLTVHNFALGGTMVSDLVRQANLAVEKNADYVTILSGANNICTPETADGIIPVAVFREQVAAGLDTLRSGLPHAQIFVASIPSMMGLWNAGHADPVVTARWNSAGICSAILADPTDLSPAAASRRAAVESIVVDMNAALAETCAAVARCTYDGGALHDLQVGIADLSTRDYFHPSISGQTKIAETTWARVVSAGIFSAPASPTPAPESSPSPTATVPPPVSASPDPTSSPDSSASPLPTGTPTPAPETTVTPTPTPTPAPSPTPTPAPTPASTTTPTPTAAPTLAASVPAIWIDDTSPSVQYAGSFAKTSSAKDYGKSVSYSGSASAAYTVPFDGTRVEVYIRKTATSGISDVWIDGARVGTIDGFAASTAYQVLAFRSGELPRGPHTLEVRSTGARWSASGGRNLILDAVRVEDAGPPAVVPVSAPGSGTYEQTAAEIVYTSSWQTSTSSGDSGGSVSFSNATGASASFRFSGSSVSWVSRQSASSGIDEVWLDGVRVATVDRYAPTMRTKRTVWTSGALTPGVHTLEIKRTGTRNAAATGANLIVDAVIVG